ncbi:MAG: diguanylate cyclase [Actinomycetales bacterium]|nr:diguanylate cyclase [Actinomycetales bacterium]
MVYQVRREGVEYALKVIRSAAADEAALAAFQREAALLACVNHPGIPRVHEVGVVHRRSYLVMDLVKGHRLTESLAMGPMDLPRVLTVALDIASALDAAHRAGVVHRDVKPDNIVIDESGSPRLIDFGLATQAVGEIGDSIVGTMTYGAPEQSGMLKRPVDARADLYSLGIVLYECLTGTPPFTAPDIGEVIRMHATMPAPDVRASRPDVPAPVAALVAKLLAKDPDDRYQSAAGLRADLQRLAEQPAADDLQLGVDDRPTQQREPMLVGRDQELEALLQMWRELSSGRGIVVLVEGPPGSGKSRLAREFLRLARGRGTFALQAKSSPDDLVPFAPLRSAVEGYVAALGELPEPERTAAVNRLRAVVGADAPTLATFSPSLGALLGIEARGDADGHSEFVSIVSSFITGLARANGPMALYLDDAQWLDDASVRVLTRVAGELVESPLFVVATSRNDDDSQAALDTLRSRLGEAVSTSLTLGPLTAGAVTRIVADLSGGMGIDTKAAAMVAARTGGNALALHEYLGSLMHSGLLRPCWGQWVLDVEHLDDLPLSGSAVDLVIRRLDDLEPSTRKLLGIGALLGSCFSADLLAQVCQIDPRRVVRIIDEATWDHLVEPRGAGRYAFLHNCVREAFLAQFDEATLRQHHQRIADVLVQSAATDPETVYATARHYQNGEVDRHERQVFRANFAAGKLALKDHAPAQAAGYFERAEEVATDAGAEFYCTLGTAHHRAGRFEDAVEVLHKALDASSDAIERATILHLIATVHDSTWDSAREIDAAERGLAELGCPLPEERKKLLRSSKRLFLLGALIGLTRIGYGKVDGFKRDKYRLLSSLFGVTAMGHTRELRPDLARAMVYREIFYVNRAGDCPENVMAKARLAALVRGRGHRRLAEVLHKRAQQTVEQLGDPHLQAFVEWMELTSRHDSGEGDGMQLRRMLDERDQLLDAGQHLNGLTSLCWEGLLHGEMGAAEALFRNRRDRVAASGQVGRNASVAAEAGLLALQGHTVEAAEYLNAMGAEPETPRWMRVDILIATLLCAIEQGDLGSAVDEVIREFDELGLAPDSLLPAQRAFYVYQAYARLEQYRLADQDQRPERLRIATEAIATLGRAADRPIMVAHHVVTRAALHQISGENRKALDVLDAAAVQLREVDAPMVAFESSRIRARALKAIGVRGEADRQARYTLTVADEQQWPRRVRWVRAEFGYAGSTAFSQQSMSMGQGSVRLHTHEGVPCSVFRHRLTALEQVSFAASRVGNPDDLAKTALDETIKMLHAERAVLFLLEGEPAKLLPYAGRDAAGNDLDGLDDYSRTLVDRVCQTQEAAVITSAGDGAEVDSGSVVIHGLRSVMAAPLQLDGRLLGVVYLDSRIAKGIFTNEDIGALTAITNYVAGALETARATHLEVAVTKATEQRDLADKLRTAMSELSGTLDPTEVLRRLLHGIVRNLGGEEGWFLTTDGQSWVVRAATTLDGPVTPAKPLSGPDPVLTRLMQDEVPFFGGNGQDGAEQARPAVLAAAGAEANSWVAIPLRRKNEQIGLILIASAETGSFGPEHTDLGAALAEQGLIAFDNARLFARVRRLATTDELTGIANRRHFFDLATREFSTVREAGRPLAALMIDIDHFKRVNDTHGHQVGDDVIRGVADRFRRTAGTGDILGRYGGEEFAVVIAAGEDVVATAERFRCAVTDEPIATRTGPLEVTVSIGVARLRATDDDIGALLGRADAQLYDAKQGGRNRVNAEDPSDE